MGDMNRNDDFTADIARSLFEYDDDTGVIKWKKRRRGTRDDLVAGGCNHGYMATLVNGRRYFNHRLAWLITYGKWPNNHLDHIDGNRSNNKITNLREAPGNLNWENHRKSHHDNNTGFLGVSFHKRANKYKSSIFTNGKYIHLGLYVTAEDAHAAYVDAKRKYHAGNTI